MKSLTKKLLASVFVMVFALVAVATTTFAWFTISNEATVGPIDVDVRTDGEDLTVKVLKSTASDAQDTAVDSTGYIKGITMKEINWAIYGAATPTENQKTTMDAISSVDGKSFYYLTDPTGTYTESDPTSWRTTGDNVGPKSNIAGAYLSFVLKFKSSSKGYLLLTTNNTAEAANTTITSRVGFQWSDKTFKEIDTITANAVDALRMSYTSTVNSDQVTTIYNPISSIRHTVSGDNGIIQGADAIANTKNNIGVLYYQNIWLNNTSVKSNLDKALVHDGTIINALDYVLKANLVDAKNVAIDNLTTYKTNHSVIGVFGSENQGVVDTIDVTINLWMEGWDADCFNAILSSKLKINLGFAILKDTSVTSTTTIR